MPRFLQLFRHSRTCVDDSVDQLMGIMASVPAVDRELAVLLAAEQLCNTTITLSEHPMPHGHYGVVLRTHQGHQIRVDPDLPGDLRFHTVLHELGHIVLGHTATSEQGANRLAQIMGGGPPVCSASTTAGQAPRETEAEIFACTMARRLRRGLTTRHMSRLDEAFG